jgi:hypothetical protein
MGVSALVNSPGGGFALAGTVLLLLVALPWWPRGLRIGGLAASLVCCVVWGVSAYQASAKASEDAFQQAASKAEGRLREAANDGVWWSPTAPGFEESIPRLLPRYAPVVERAVSAAQSSPSRLNTEVAGDACRTLVIMETSLYARPELERSGYRAPKDGPWMTPALAAVLMRTKGSMPHAGVVSECGRLFGVTI